MSGPLLFDDSVDFQFQLKLKPNTTLPLGKTQAAAVTPWEMAYTVHNVTTQPLAGQQLRSGHYLSYQVRGMPIATCNTDLGMDDAANGIKDCALSAFMAPFDGHEATQARPSGAGWKPHIRGGDYNQLRYITALFGSMKDVRQIKVFAVSNQSVARIIVIYRTLDGRSFVPATRAVS